MKIKSARILGVVITLMLLASVIVGIPMTASAISVVSEPVVATVTTTFANGGAAAVFSVIYTDQDGNGSQAGTLTIPANTVATTSVAVALATGDTGVQDITAVVLTTAGGHTAGAFSLVGTVTHMVYGSVTNTSTIAHTFAAGATLPSDALAINVTTAFATAGVVNYLFTYVNQAGAGGIGSIAITSPLATGVTLSSTVAAPTNVLITMANATDTVRDVTSVTWVSNTGATTGVFSLVGATITPAVTYFSAMTFDGAGAPYTNGSVANQGLQAVVTTAFTGGTGAATYLVYYTAATGLPATAALVIPVNSLLAAPVAMPGVSVANITSIVAVNSGSHAAGAFSVNALTPAIAGIGTVAISGTYSIAYTDGSAHLPIPVVLAPAAGAANVSTTPTLQWDTSNGATGFELIVSTSSALDSTGRLATAGVVDKTGVAAISGGNSTAYTIATALSNATTYYWQVRATTTGTIFSPWSSVYAFTTAGVPATTPPVTITTIVVTQPPVTTITITQPAPTTITYTIPPAEAQPTPAWVWAVIAIGGVLLVVVIVLIARTRKI